MELCSSCNFVPPMKRIFDVHDHISQLPDVILSHILIFLNLKEAFRTRLLARRWRYLCVHMSNLVFDSTFITGFNDEQALDSSFLMRDKHKFVERVSQFLNMITIQKPMTLKVCFSLGQEFASHIDGWISFAIRMGSEEIELDFGCAVNAVYGNSFGPYNFPCHLLHSREKSQLKYLSLSKCIFHPPLEIAQRLDSLKNLKLDNVHVGASDLENILSTCSKLEYLKLIDCELLSALRICNQDLGLKCLIVNSFTVVARIELSVPNLEMFEFKGWVQDFTFSSLHQLKMVALSVYGNNEGDLNHLLAKLSRNVPQLQTLALTWCYDQNLSYVYIPNHTPMFNNLIQLQLTIKGDFRLNLFAYMLYRSPNLEALVINKGYPPPTDGEPSWIHPQFVPTCISYCLKEVRFEEFYGHDCELEFVAYILKNASFLEEMSVTITIPNVVAIDQIINTINAFPRRSETCVLFYELNIADPPIPVLDH